MLKLKKLSDKLIEEYANIVIEYLQNVKNRNKKNKLYFDFIKSLDDKNMLKELKDVVIREFRSNNLNVFPKSCKLNNIFDKLNWETFRNNEKRKEIFEKIIKANRIKVCPYCGRNYIDVVEVFEQDDSTNNKKKVNDKKKIIIPCLDHFYAKGAKTEFEIKNNNQQTKKYFQFCFSIYNLIPSCYLCNSQLKHEKDVADKKFNILYPYKEGFEDYVKFNLGDSSEKDLMKVAMLLTGDSTVDTSSLEIKLVKDVEKINQKIPMSANADIPLSKRGRLEDDGFLDRCKNSNRMFHIEEIYNTEHKQNALDLINKIVWYRKNYIKSLNSIFPSLRDYSQCLGNNQLLSFIGFINKINTNQSLDINDLLGDNFEFLFGRWLDPENDLKEPLSKFYRDIYNQIKKPRWNTALEDKENE